MRTDPDVKGIKDLRNGERDRVLYLSGRKDGMRNRCLRLLLYATARTLMSTVTWRNKEESAKDGPVFRAEEVELPDSG